MSTTPQTNGHPAASTSTEVVAASNAQTGSKVSPSDVGWQFVPQYYNFVNKQPHRLHCFYNKRSTFVHGEEGDEVTPAHGQQDIHDRIVKIGYDQCKVYINSIDSQSSAGGGIIIQVLGEMSNANKPWRKFAQTFFLAEQPNGYFVLNDIFRYLKEDTDDDEEVEVDEAPVVSAAPAVQAEQAHAAAAPIAPVAVEEEIASTPEPEAKEEVPAPELEVAEKEPEPVVEASPEPVKEKETPAPEPEVAAAPEPEPEAAPVPAPTPKAAPVAEKPVEKPVEKSVEKAAPAPAPAAAPPAPTPAPAPAAPVKPKSWASLAAGGAGAKSWGAVAASGTAPAAPAKKAEAPAAAPAAPVAAPTPAAAATPAAATPAANGGAASASGRHQYYDNAMKVNTSHCFVKLPNWSPQDSSASEAIDENTLRNIASRFGEVLKVEIVKGKACAFIEFAKVESARKAIVASLSTHQGGEGGVPHGEGRLNFETRKEKDERGPKGARRGGAPETGRPSGGARSEGGGQQQQQQRGANAGRGRGRGRGGNNNAGDRAAK